jgi:hypothetical protein
MPMEILFHVIARNVCINLNGAGGGCEGDDANYMSSLIHSPLQGHKNQMEREAGISESTTLNGDVTL